MAYLKLYDHNLGRMTVFASRKARDRKIKDMLRKQQRLIEGITVTTQLTRVAEPTDGKPRGYYMGKNTDYRALEKQAQNLARLVKEYKL
ncbi:MAG: hypothetical protein JKY50_00020 [Oleispira sp.]|nr:hypothetical protein [Oleispira sp.]